MASRHHTIIFVPHERAKFRKWRVSNTQLITATGLLVGVTATALFITWSFFTSRVNHAELERLRSENEQLRTLASSFESGVGRLQQQLSDYETRTRKLAIVAGVESLGESTEGGVGGADASRSLLAPARLDELAARAIELERSLEEVDSALDERHQRISALPAIAPVRGLITSGFGLRSDPLNGRPTLHPAIDIAAPPGKPVVATADGFVLRAGWDSGLGNAVVLSHGFGITTRFGHLSKLAVQPGAKVKRGDVIGYVGNTGRSTGYHLHYEVLVNGEHVNPLGYILDSASDPS
jgi:murein DD-endopeptidase MepM/ murein hydrolase activator NlpD